MHVVLVDDDHLRAEATKQILVASVDIPENDIEIVTCESDFIWALDARWIDDPPDLFVIDVMLPWVDQPHPGMKPPPSRVLKEGYWRAGIRCAERVRATLGNHPAITVLTVIPRSKLTELAPLTKVSYLYKDERGHSLVDWARRALSKSS